MDRERLTKFIDNQIEHLSEVDIIKIAHIVDPVVEAKYKIYKEEGLYIIQSAIDTETLQRIYDFIAAKLKTSNIE